MKTVVTKLLFVFFIFSASVYAQYFIDEDIIREHRNSNNRVLSHEDIEGKKIFLTYVGGRMRTNVYIGFDKTEYKKGDEVTLTIKRDNDERFKDYTYTVTLYPGSKTYERAFKLDQGEMIEVKTILPKENYFHHLTFSVQAHNIHTETIVFGIRLQDDPDNPPEENDAESYKFKTYPPPEQDLLRPKSKGIKLRIKGEGQSSDLK